MNIIHKGGVYQSSDGRYTIERGVVSEGFCECPENVDPCPHYPDGIIYRYGWWVWDTKRDDYAFDHQTWDTFREARAALTALLDNQVWRVKFPRPTKGETT